MQLAYLKIKTDFQKESRFFCKKMPLIKGIEWHFNKEILINYLLILNY